MDLKRCATKTTIEGESSKLMEETQLMEECPAFLIDSGKKRKAESETAEDENSDDSEDCDNKSCDDDEYVDCDEEYMKLTAWDLEPQWDVDSFEGLEYNSPEEDELSDKEFELNWRRYKRVITESKGFDAVPGPRLCLQIRGIVQANLEAPAGHGQTTREYFADLARLCLEKYNQDHNKDNNGFNVEFVDVVKGNFTTGGRRKYYITFLAKEKPDVAPIQYQAKVWCTFIKGDNYPILCRPAPKTNQS